MLCPVCNGLQPLFAQCENCHELLSDLGRIADWTGPYAPYEPWEASEQGFEQTAETAHCKHIAFCLNCERTVDVGVTEWR